MKTVDLRRTLRKGWACAAVAAFAGLAVLPASAEVANPNLLPADSAYIFSIPDSPAFWSAWEGNGLYEAFNKVMAMDEVQQKTSDVKQQVSIIESSLGFKLDGATLSQIFSSVDIYMQPVTEPGKVEGVAILTVADDDKTSKLLDLAEKAAIKSAESDDATTGAETASNDSGTSVVTEANHNGVIIKQFRDADGDVQFAYARANNLLMLAADEDSLRTTIDRSKAEAATSGTLAASEDYAKVTQALQAEKGQAYFYGDVQASTSKMFAEMEDAPQALRGAVQSLFKNMQPTKFYGASIQIAPKEIYSYSYGLLREDTGDSMAVRNPGDQPLRVATFIPENSMWAAATSLLDVESISSVVSSAMGSTDGAEEVTAQVRSVEEGLGFSIKDDLVPALGNEVAFALQNVEMTGLIPSADVTFILGVKDKARMQKVVDGAEKMASTMVSADSASEDEETTGTGFKSEEVNGQTIKYVELQGMLSLTPGYVLTDDYLVIGSTRGALANALRANGDGKNLVDGNALKRLGHGIDGRGNVIQFMDFAKIIDLAKQVTQMFPATRPAVKYLDVASVLDASGGTSRIEDGAAVTRSVLKLK